VRIAGSVVLCVCVMGGVGAAAQGAATVTVRVRAEAGPLDGAAVTLGGQAAVTDAEGRATLTVPAGQATLVVKKEGFFPLMQALAVAGERLELIVDLVATPEIQEEVVVVASTRTGRRVDEQPTRVEVLGREEIEEKMLMTPGDIVMMLNEMGGLRVQATSPSIGAASVRVQGMKGRYTRFLSDGLPLFGQQVGGLGLLQIPPMDLGQVEVIKGVASALYGAGAMGGVVNLLSRRPADEPIRDALVNQSTLGATDAVVFLASAAPDGWRASLLASGHRQTRNDRDDDGWADIAGYERGVVRPRVFRDGGNGRSSSLTAGVTVENRQGGTLPGTTLAATGAPYVEALDTRRYDVGGTLQTVLGGRYVLTARGAAAWQRRDHRFGEVRERDRHDTVFTEVAVRGTAGRHTWVAGAAYERDGYTPTDVPRFAYTYDVPGVFAQDDVDLASWLSLSAGARVDRHSEYGTFLSPRVAVLIRATGWTSRASVGRGFFAATPLTEETEAAGLTRLEIPRPLEAERGTSASLDVTKAIGSVSVTATVFRSRIAKSAAVDRDTRYVLFNRSGATTNVGAELLATARRGPWVATSTYTYVRSREDGGVGRQDVALTPRHSAGLVGMWEAEAAGRAGLEVYYTGRQRLEVNPYRDWSRSYVIVGLLAEKRVGRLRVFVNVENLTDVRQTRWDPLLQSSRSIDGRWTVDAWAPLDGRVLNGGVRVAF
jgi:outer membrane receptor for ferrienterochelin and colicins